MKHAIRILLTISIYVLFACSKSQPISTPNTQDSTKDESPTAITLPTANIQYPTGTEPPFPTATPNLVEQLPAGLYIAYVKNRINSSELQDLYLISDSGREYGPLLRDIEENIAIAPDGETVAYSKFVEYGIYELRILNLKTFKANSFRIPDCYLSDNRTAWSPDSKALAVSCWNMISKVSLDDGKLSITESLIPANEDDYIANPTWSPNGEYLSFHISKPLDAHDSSAHGPFLIDSKCPQEKSECQIIPFSFSMGMNDTPLSHWTPDDMLATVQNNQFNIYDPIKKTLVRTIKFSSKTPILSFVWSPDNQWIAYRSVSEISTNAIYLLPTSGGQPALISESGGDVVFWLKID